MVIGGLTVLGVVGGLTRGRTREAARGGGSMFGAEVSGAASGRAIQSLRLPTPTGKERLSGTPDAAALRPSAERKAAAELARLARLKPCPFEGLVVGQRIAELEPYRCQLGMKLVTTRAFMRTKPKCHLIYRFL
jgi:hypothetical protein